MTETRKFQIGQIYTARSACDHNCVFEFKVTSRTAKFITIEDKRDRTRRVGVYVPAYDNAERAMPLGKYSMAPVITA